MDTAGMSSPRLTIGRYSEIGLIYSVTTICHRRSPFFLDAGVVSCLARELLYSQRKDEVANIAWVAMPDHLHWLFELRAGTLASSVASLKGRTARAIGRLHGKNGAFWQAGYFDHALRHEDAVGRHVRYLIENPIRAGLVRHISEYPHWWCAWDPLR